VLGFLTLGVPCVVGAATPFKIAVAPFAGEFEEVRMSELLAAHLARRPLERVIEPNALPAEIDADPTAALIRQWAYNTSVDTIVVGQVVVPEAARSGEWAKSGFEVEVVLRSGHSGAEVGRHRVSVAGLANLDDAAERLAEAILEDLGYAAAEEGIDPGLRRDPRSPEPLVRVAEPPRSMSPASPDHEEALAADFEIGRLRENSPIEIEAEEAEIVNEGDSRRLIFQTNVRVRHGDLQLESDVLEAEYRKGESEPDRLIARGSVKIIQGFRSAKCDRAVYQRVEQMLSCEGHAELIQGCDIVRGDSIEFDLGGNHARVLGAASIVIRPSDDAGRSCATLDASL